MAMHLAFYRGRGRFIDRIIRAITRSPYSHVELLRHRPVPGDSKVPAISASSRDGGVKEREIDFASRRWDFLPLDGWAKADAWERAARELDLPYDYPGIVFNFIIPIRRRHRRSWFCSELCGWAIGLKKSNTLSPGDLYTFVQELNHACRCGQISCGGRPRA